MQCMENTENSKKASENYVKKIGKNSDSCGNMPQRTTVLPKNISLSELVSNLTRSQRERLISGYDVKSFARIFEHADLMLTVDAFFENGMNVSETSRRLYMHRNTLIYRLNKIQKSTGFDLRNFETAVTFQILRILYELK